jgi:hypothetical protein
MFRALAASALLALASPAMAQDAKPNVPTGIDVPGPTHYRLSVGGYQVIKVDCDKKADFLEVKNMALCQRANGGESANQSQSTQR